MHLICEQLSSHQTVLTLDRSTKANALNNELIIELLHAFATCANHSQEIILQSNGKHFCSGLDLNEIDLTQHSQEYIISVITNFTKLIGSIANYPHHITTYLNGAALGGGLGIALLSDRIVCGPTAIMHCPERNHNIHPYIIAPIIAHILTPAGFTEIVNANLSLTPCNYPGYILHNHSYRIINLPVDATINTSPPLNPTPPKLECLSKIFKNQSHLEQLGQRLFSRIIANQQNLTK